MKKRYETHAKKSVKIYPYGERCSIVFRTATKIVLLEVKIKEERSGRSYRKSGRVHNYVWRG